MNIPSFARISSRTRNCVFIFFLFLFFFISSCTHTQTSQSVTKNEITAADIATAALDQHLPQDPQLITGKLDNGLTYYIRKNTEPENRAELRLVINSGSILEDDTQRGLAHFLEHMAFQGTSHFEKQSIVDFMESIGMPFGSGINAATGLDETYYMLVLPTDDKSHIETAFQILRDWATEIKFEPEEIDLERKVVIEEWRLGQGAGSRISKKILPVIFKDSLYAERLPIGKLEQIRNFTREDFLRFYRDWYRPDLMAVIAVGDFDTADIKKLIHEKFDSIPKSENPRERKVYPVPDHDETLFAIAADPEVQETDISVYYKSPKIFDWTAGGYRKTLVENIYNSMLNYRFGELTIKPNPPFMGASSGRVSIIRNEDIYTLGATVQETGIERGLETILTESERVLRHGFTSEELERTKKSYMRSMELAYANRDSRGSSSHASEMSRSFLTGEHIPGIEVEMQLYNRFIPEISLDEVNQVAKTLISDSNRVVVLTAPEKPDLNMPSETALKSILASVPGKDIVPYTPTKVEGELLDSVPSGSNVIEERELEGGITEWKLANGITVALKPTDFVEDQIMFIATSNGGTSLASDENFIPAKTASALVAVGGLGKFNIMDLQKKLTGKAARVTASINEYQEGLSGAASPKDLETMFQLIYLRVTEPRSDETVYNILKTQLQQQLQNKDSNPSTVFQETWNRMVYSNHSRKEPDSLETLEKFDLAKSMEFYKDRFADTGDFVFVFTGSFTLEQMRPFVETYLGALPSTGRKETWKDVGIRGVREGIIKETVYKGKEPKSSTRIGFNGYFPMVDDQREVTCVSISTQILENRLREIIRERMGGTYSIVVRSGIVRIPEGQYLISIDFSSDPERIDELTAAIFDEIKAIKESGPTENEVSDIRTTLIRAHETGMKQNATWLASISASYVRGDNPGAERLLKAPEIINSISKDDIKETFNMYYDFENYLQAALMPEEAEQ